MLRNVSAQLAVMLLIFIVMEGCTNINNEDDVRVLSTKLDTLMNSMFIVKSEDPIYNAVLLVESPKITWEGAAGLADGKQEIMTPKHKFKIASIGKMFTATIVLQLIEEGYLKLDVPIKEYLDNPIVIMDSLLIYEGKSYGRQITIEQLLSHTSGLKDYMEDPRFIPDVAQNPNTQFSARKILEKYYEYHTNRKASFQPGNGFEYSDVNYVLLAMIIERLTEQTYHSQLRTRIFDPLEMKNSYLEYYEEPRGEKPLSHAFFGIMDLTTEINTSFDWGGGGIVSTCDELNTFIRALFCNKLFKNELTLQRMLEAADEGRGGVDYTYGFGIMKRTIDGLIFYGHGGAYDCDLFFCPEKNISVCMSLNQMNTHGKRDELVMKAVKLIM